MTTSVPATEPESRWLLRLLAWTFVATGVFLLIALTMFGWPLDKVGDGYQLLGLFVAALGVPVVSPWLRRVEDALAAAAASVRRWALPKLAQLRRRWDRFRGRPQRISLTPATEVSSAVNLKWTVRRRTVDRQSTPTREWLAFVNDQVDELWATLQQLQDSSGDARRELDERLVAHRRELQAHTVAVTRSGWQFILAGAGCTALGIALSIIG